MTTKNKNDKGADSAGKHEAPSSSQVKQINNNMNNTVTLGEGPEVEYSIVTNSNGPLSKKFCKGSNGALLKVSYGSMYKGTIETCKGTVGALRASFKRLRENQAILLGLPKNAAAKWITTVGNSRVGNNGFIARSKDHIVWIQGARLVLLDIDKFDGTREEMEAALRLILPEIDGVAMFIRPSVSTCIMDAAGNVVRPENKWHAYFVIDSNQDMKALKDTLEGRCWLHRHGWLITDATGRRVLSRTLFDLSVLSPERLVFEADPILPDGYESFRDECCTYTNGGIMPTLIPLTIQEQEEVRRLKAEARKDPLLNTDMAAKRAAYEPILKEIYFDMGLTGDVVNKAIQAFYASEYVVFGSTPVFLKKSGQEDLEDAGIIFAGDLLWNPSIYDQAYMLDPEDPTYQDNDRIARFEIKMIAFGGYPGIQSFAHGGSLYWVKYDIAYLLSKLQQLQRDGNTAGLADRLVDMLENTRWDDRNRHVEQDKLKRELKAVAGISFDVFTKTLKAVERAGNQEANDNQAAQSLRANIENHNDAARYLLEDFTVDGGEGIGPIPPIGCDGKLFKYDLLSGLWVGWGPDELQSYIGEKFKGPKCNGVADFKHIASHSYKKVSDSGFFSDAPEGVPCRNGFVKIDKDGKAELLSYTTELRQTTKLSLDGIILTDDEQRLLDGYDQLDALGVKLFGDHIRTTLGEKDFTAPEVREQVNAYQMAAGGTLGGVLHKSQKAMIFKGDGGNGKTVAFNVKKRMLDPAFVTASSPMDWHRPQGRLILAGKRINIVPELAKGKAIPDGDFKTIVGADSEITVKKLFVDEYTFLPRVAHWFGTNHTLKTVDKSAGFFRRLFCFDCPHAFKGEEMISDYDEILFEQEGTLILTWFIEGMRKFVEAGYKLPHSTRSVAMIEDWRNAADSVRAFLTEYPFKTKSGTIAFGEYQSFCYDCGNTPLSRNNFYLELGKYGYSRKMDPKTKTLSFTNDSVDHDVPYRDPSYDYALHRASTSQPVYDDDIESL